jgi:hypothetical protein
MSIKDNIHVLKQKAIEIEAEKGQKQINPRITVDSPPIRSTGKTLKNIVFIIGSLGLVLFYRSLLKRIQDKRGSLQFLFFIIISFALLLLHKRFYNWLDSKTSKYNYLQLGSPKKSINR